MFMKM